MRGIYGRRGLYRIIDRHKLPFYPIFYLSPYPIPLSLSLPYPLSLYPYPYHTLPLSPSHTSYPLSPSYSSVPRLPMPSRAFPSHGWVLPLSYLPCRSTRRKVTLGKQSSVTPYSSTFPTLIATIPSNPLYPYPYPYHTL